MNKRNKIIYWISTVWLALAMVSSGIVQLLQVEEEIAFILHLGYPAYFLYYFGCCKLLGVIAILIPKRPVLKEWAYAGFFFSMTGAVYSHIIMKSGMSDLFPAVLVLTLTCMSWYFRPADRKVITLPLNVQS